MNNNCKKLVVYLAKVKLDIFKRGGSIMLLVSIIKLNIRHKNHSFFVSALCESCLEFFFFKSASCTAF